jgi:hypothetical protein
MESDRFRPLLDAPGPFASVFYFDDSHDIHDANAQLDLKWRALREQLERQGADESVTAHVGQAVMDARAPIGRSGRAVLANADGVLLNAQLLRPTAEMVVRVSEVPYIMPLVEHGFDHPNYLLVEVDHTGADVTADINGTLRSETVDGGTDGAARKNVRAIADRVSELVDEEAIGVIFVVGEVRSRSDLLTALPERLRERTIPLEIGARHSGHDDDKVERDIEAVFRRRRLNVVDHVAARFTTEIGRKSGLAAEGLGAVCSALRRGAVDTIIIGDGIDGLTVVVDQDLTTVAPNANVLSLRGAAPAMTLRADEALPMFAISVGASLVRTDERISPADGVAALLRHAPTLHQASR